MDNFLNAFPKERRALPEEYKKIYAQEYKMNRTGGSFFSKLSQSMEAWMHKKVAAISARRILEIGAGTLNQVKFESNYITYDIVEPFEELFRDSPDRHKVQHFYQSVHDIPDDQKFDKVSSVAVLEHLEDLPQQLAKIGVLLEDQGTFISGIPAEGGLLWWVGWRSTTGLSYYLRNKLDYGVLMKHEHVNNQIEIISLIKYFFDDVKVQGFPFNCSHLSLYRLIQAKNPNKEICKTFLAQTKSN